MDVTCFKCGGKGLPCAKAPAGLKPWAWFILCSDHERHDRKYSGFAFGVGLERIALLKYEIDDMRLLYENDTRF
ncbi:MAG: hypothetical protein ACLSFZ_07185 [Frisingicoccus sp.]